MQVNKSRKLWVYLNLVLAIGLVSQITLSGCLPPEAQAALNKLEYRRSEIQAAVDSIEKEMALVRTAMQEGKVTAELGKQLLAGWKEKKGKLLQSFKPLDKEIGEARAAGVPWWGYIPTILAAVGGIGGSVMGIRKVGAIGKVASTALSAFGALSRAADGAGDGQAPAELRANMEAEIKASPGLTTETVKALHARAKDGNI